MNQVNTRSKSHASIEALLLPECPECGGTDVLLENQQQSFRYGHGTDSAEINCTVPVYRCATCDFQWTGAAAEDVRQEAICRHLGRLSPNEVLGIRERHNLSQAEFSKITGFGEASLSRWETGAQIQNVSGDRLLRLLDADPRNLDHLKEVAYNQGVVGAPRFRVISITPQIRCRQAAFKLREAG